MAVEQVNRGRTKVRSMASGDVGAIIEINRSLLGEGRALTMSDLVTEDISGALDLSLVSEFENQVVGFILVRHTYIGEPVVEAALVQGLAVHPLYQQQGIGTQLVNALTERCKGRNIKTIRVILNVRDSRLEGFFSHMNFRRAQLVVCDMLL
ncbi:MAG: GNAT family N-acetyltransferase [Dehalococcoidales bacterium]|nr:GNAT family N-acetyltransferase [Dehalococcoidales bacterium]